MSVGWRKLFNVFQSTRPARGATGRDGYCKACRKVSIHAPRAGRDPRSPVRMVDWTRFNPRAPRGARRRSTRFSATLASFNPRAPRGARLFPFGIIQLVCLFQSTRPARGATVLEKGFQSVIAVSIHAPRAGRDCCDFSEYATAKVSIHAPRAGRDGGRRGWFPKTRGFNPRAPRGARPSCGQTLPAGLEFQSTRPARGATPLSSGRRREKICFNPRAPRGARQIHRCSSCAGAEFQSTRPARGATWRHGRWLHQSPVSIHAPRAGRDRFRDPDLRGLSRVSIHAPRAGRDPCGVSSVCITHRFNPRAPRGARRCWARACMAFAQFQSTRPARGATVTGIRRATGHRFQSTRPARGATLVAQNTAAFSAFQSTRPARGATALPCAGDPLGAVSIHAPRAGRDALRR